MTTEFLNGLNQQERTQKHDQVGSTTPSGGCDSLISSKTAKKSHLLEEPQIIDPSNRYLEVSQSSDQAQTPDNQEEQTANELIIRTVEATSTVDCRQIRGPNCDTRTTSKTRTIDDRRANTTITTRDRSGRVQRSIDSRSILNNKEKLKRFWEKRMEMEFKTRAEQQEQARRLSLAADEEQSDQNNNATDEMGFRLKGQKLRGAPASIRSAAASENEPNFDENNNDNDNENYNQTDDYAELVSAEVLCEKLLAVKRRRQGCVLDDDNASGQGDLNGRKLDRQHGAKPVSAANRESSVAADQQPMSINPVLCHLDEEEQPEQPPRQLQCLKIGTGGESLLTLAGCDEREEQSANEEFSSSNSSFGPMSISLTKTNGHDEDQQQAISSPLDSKPATGSSDDDEQGNDEEEEEEETSTQSGSVLTVISSNNNNSNNNNNNNLASDQTTTNQQREPKTGDQHTIDGVATATTSLITSIEDHQNTFNDAYNDGQGEGEQQSVREQEENDEDDGQQSNVEEQESDGSNIGVAFESLQFDDEIKSSKNELVDEARLLANDHYGSNNNNNGKGLQKVQAARRSTTTNPDKSSSSSSLSSAALLRASAATSESRAESTNNNNNNNNYNSSSSNSNRPMSKFNSREVKSVCSIITNAISDATKQVDDYIKSRARLGCADEGEHCAGKRRLANDDDEHDDDDDQEEAVAGAGRQPKVGSQFRAIVASDHSRRHEGDAAGDADCEDEDEEEAGGDVDNSAMMNRQRRRLRPIEGFQRATFVHESMAQVDAKPIGTTAASSAGPLQSGAPKLVSSRHDEDDDNENKFNHSGMEGTNDDDDDDERLSARPTPRHQPNSTILFNGCASSAEGEEADADDDDNDEEDDDDEAICNGFDEVPRADLSSIFEANVRREIERFESNSATAQLKRQLDSQGPGGQQQLSGGGGCGGSGAKSIAGQHQQTLSRSGLTEWRIAEEIRLFNERENELKQRSGGSSAQGAVGPAIAQRTTPNEKQQQQLEPVVRNGKTLHIPKHSVDKQPPAAGAVQMSRCIKLTTSSTNNAEQQQPTMISMHKFISSGGKRYVYQPISTMSNNSLANNTSHHHLTKSMSNLSSLSSSSSSSRTVDYRAVDSLRCKEVPNVKPGMTKKTIETFSRLTNAESGGGSLNRLDLSATQTTLAPSQEPGVQDHSQTRNSCGKARARYQNQAQKANGIPSAEWKIQEELREMKAREAELRSLRNNQLRQQKQPQEGPGETGLILEENETKESGYSNSRHRFMPTSDGLNRHQQPRKRTQSANFITTNDDHEPLEEEQQLQEGVMSVTGTVEDADEVHLLVNSQCVITTMNGHQHQSPPHNQNGAASNGKLFAASNGHSDWNKQQHGREQRSTGHDGDMEIERTDSDASSSPISSHSLYPIKQTIDSFRKLNASTESDNNNNSNNKRPARQVLMTQQMERGGGKKQTPPGKQQQQKRFVNSSASSVARSPAGSANITAAIAANNSLIARRPI